jgi:hypothetical protein
MRDEVRQQLELLRRELDRLARDFRLAPLAVDRDVPERRIAFIRATSSRGENGFVT